MACDIDGYVGVIDKEGQEVLVLNDEPMQATFVEDNQGLMCVRWMYAPNEDAVKARLAVIRPCLREAAEVVEFKVHEDNFLLLDSATDTRKPCECLQVHMHQGVYRVTTYVDKAAEGVGLVVAAFRWVS